MKKQLLIFCFLLGLIQTQAQENDIYKLKSLNFKPTVGVGIGMLSYYGDISKKNKTNNPLISDLGYDFRVSFPLYNSFDIHFYSLIGKTGANEVSATRNLNFKSNIFAGGIAVAYNFNHFLPQSRIIEPYISLGIESLEFNSKTDVIDEFGNNYFYWADGTIRNLPELPENEFISQRLSRDYVFETDIRTANVDGFGNYRENTMAMPIGVGATLYLTPKVLFRVGTSLHLTFTDYIDGVTEKSIGIRAGDSKNDKLLYSSFSLAVNLSREPSYMGLSKNDLKALDLGDQDDDGVIDLKDNCPNTPLGVEVDAKGCPKDSDGDGIPDYRDKDPNTPKDALVDTAGNALTPEQIDEMSLQFSDSISQKGTITDTSYALELTDKTARPKGTKPTTTTPTTNEKTTATTPTQTQPKTNEKAIEGLDIPLPSNLPGVVYRVQIMATKAKPRNNPFKNVPELSGAQFGDGYYRFFSGNFNSEVDAQNARENLKKQGISGAYIRVFQDGVLLPAGQKPTGKPATIPNSNNMEQGKTLISPNPQNLENKTLVLPNEMDKSKFLFRILLAEYSGNVPSEELSTFEKFGPVDTENVNGKTYVYIGEFPELDMAKSFKRDLENGGLKNLKITGQYDGKIIPESEFNSYFK